MVGIWNMGVAVRDRLMLVPMAVGACRHRLMHMVMVMVPIVMPVGVFMFQFIVGVVMGMGLHQVQQNT